VDDITAVVIILLEGNPKDKSWGAACKVRLHLCYILPCCEQALVKFISYGSKNAEGVLVCHSKPPTDAVKVGS